MITTRIEDTTQDHLKEILPLIKKIDVDECVNFSGLSMAQGLERSVQHSKFVKSVFVNDELVAIFGVAAENKEEVSFDYVGHPWLLTVENPERFAKAIVKYSKYYVKLMLDLFPLLVNYEGINNTTGIRWLKWCGFKFAEEPIEVNGNKFLMFTMGG